MYKFRDPIEKEKYENLLKFVSENSEKLRRNEGLPIKNDCRIDENSFKKVIPLEEIEGDKEKIRKIKDGWLNQEKNKEALGEKLEVFKTAIFQKFMGNDYITIRSNEFDDVINGVDNIIIDKKTGNIVSAFDEVMIRDEFLEDERKEKKNNKIRKLNKEGVLLKYGIKFSTKTGEKRVAIDRTTKIPIFCLDIPKNELEYGINNFDDEKASAKTFNSFMFKLQEQMEIIKDYPEISKDIIEKIEIFKKSLAEKKYIK